jgi:quercetin dioxygenase-like cupin family protein
MSQPAPAPSRPTAPPAFRYDTSQVAWADFFTPGTYYRILNVDLASRTADMLVRFAPRSECMYHRHACCTTTLVLEGELRVREQVDSGEVLKVKAAGSYSRGGEGEVHIEGSGDEDAIIFFAMKTDGDVIYELLNDDLSLRRAVTVEDFHRDWQRHWPGEQD